MMMPDKVLRVAAVVSAASGAVFLQSTSAFSDERNMSIPGLEVGKDVSRKKTKKQPKHKKKNRKYRSSSHGKHLFPPSPYGPYNGVYNDYYGNSAPGNHQQPPGNGNFPNYPPSFYGYPPSPEGNSAQNAYPGAQWVGTDINNFQLVGEGLEKLNETWKLVLDVYKAANEKKTDDLHALMARGLMQSNNGELMRCHEDNNLRQLFLGDFNEKVKLALRGVSAEESKKVVELVRELVEEGKDYVFHFLKNSLENIQSKTKGAEMGILRTVKFFPASKVLGIFKTTLKAATQIAFVDLTTGAPHVTLGVLAFPPGFGDGIVIMPRECVQPDKRQLTFLNGHIHLDDGNKPLTIDDKNMSVILSRLAENENQEMLMKIMSASLSGQPVDNDAVMQKLLSGLMSSTSDQQKVAKLIEENPRLLISILKDKKPDMMGGMMQKLLDSMDEKTRKLYEMAQPECRPVDDIASIECNIWSIQQLAGRLASKKGATISSGLISDVFSNAILTELAANSSLHGKYPCVLYCASSRAVEKVKKRLDESANGVPHPVCDSS